MKKIYHISLASHDEVLFRNDTDLIRGFNSLALAALETDSQIIADGFPTTHFHTLVLTDAPEEVLRRTRFAYARYFNTRYKRIGRLGEKRGFILPIDGFYHTLAALNYINRQAIHHGLASTPFGYPHCSAGVFFAKQLGKQFSGELMPDHLRYKYLPKGVSIPTKYRMNAVGLLLREDILDTGFVESYYGTPRNYLYQMNRLGDEIFKQEQQDESPASPPITLSSIEKGIVGKGLSEILSQPNDKDLAYNITDIELCSIIDGTCLPRYCKVNSIYETTQAQRAKLYDLIQNNLWRARHKRTSEAQLKRCLCL